MRISRTLAAATAALLLTGGLAGPRTTLAHPAHAASGSLPLGWATYLGGTAYDQVDGIAADSEGDVYVTGYANSADFPVTPGAAQSHLGGPKAQNAFVAAYDPRGRVRWATYLGGTGQYGDKGDGIAADTQGNVYVTGGTSSTDFPVTPGATQPRYGGGDDAFVASYDQSGHLRWATYLGGKGSDVGMGIAADAQGNVYVTGGTSSTDFPVTSGAAQPHSDGDDAFVASYDASGHLRWATYLGGKGDDVGNSIAVDGQGNIYLTGDTDSTDFPVTPGAAQHRRRGGDAFVASYDQTGHVRWATYLGGTGYDRGTGIAADGQGSVYVSGPTNSRDFPATSGAAQPRYGGGGNDAFVASYDAQGRLRWATYLGGSANDEAYAVAADQQDGVYVTGRTSSGDFPASPGAAQPRALGCGSSPWFGCDAFVAAYDGGGRPRWATYFGGKGDDEGLGIAADGQGNVDLTGITLSDDFPVTAGAAQSVTARFGPFVAHLVVPPGHPAALDPASPPPPGTPHARFFPATRHTLAGPFLAFWDKLGGIPALGLPLSEPFDLGGQQVQVTERAVLVLAGSQVTLLPLGTLLSAARAFAPVAPVPNTATRLYFSSTGHTLSGPFLAYWQTHQGSTLLGPPISEPDREGTGDGTGRVYLVQWFANGRLELHPEMKDVRYQVEQGRVGYEYLHRAGLL